MVRTIRTMIDATTDPRLNLRSRIRAIDKEVAEIDFRRAKLLKLKTTYETILRQEEALNTHDIVVDESTVPAFHPTGRATFADFLVRVLGTGPHTLDQLKELLASVPALQGSNSPGRAINFALVGLQKGNYVE